MDIMTKVRVLWEKLAGLETKEAATAATLAGILPRIPKDYSTSETATGLKWIDGKEIFRLTFSGIGPAEAGTVTLMTNFSYDTIIEIDGIVKSNITISNATKQFSIYQQNILYGCAATNVEQPYTCNVYFTKNTPGRITGEEPETKKRKTTKKEDK